MKLYQDKYAVNPRRVRIFAAEKGIDLELSDIQIAKKDNLTGEFLAKNPLGLVPVLELDDGRLLCESMAICRFLDEQHTDPALFGTGAFERATIEQWNRHAEFELLLPFAQAFRHTHEFWEGRIEQAPAWGETCKRNVLRSMKFFDDALASREFIAGDTFSVADISTLCGIDFGKLSKIRVTEEWPNLLRWYDMMGERPSSRA